MSHFTVEIDSVVDEDICEDLVLDMLDLQDNNDVPCLYYPAGDMVSSSVINLMSIEELAKNTFVQLLMQVQVFTNSCLFCYYQLIA